MAQKLTTGRVSVGLAGGGAFGLGPSRRREVWHFGGFGFGQAFKDILKIFGRIDAVTAATAQHRVDHCTALPGLGVPDE